MNKTMELKVYGGEPEWEGKTFSNTVDAECELLKALNWYNYSSSDQQSKAWLIDYMKANGYEKSQIEIVDAIPPKNIQISYGELPDGLGLNTGIISRLVALGAPVSDSMKQRLSEAILFLINKKQKVNQAVPEGVTGPNVQNFISEKSAEIIGNLEIICDRTLTGHSPNTIVPGSTQKALEINIKKMTLGSGSKTAPKISVSVSEAKEALKNVKPIYFPKIISHYTPVLAELKAVINKTDEDLVKAYDIYDTKSVENLVKCIEEIIAECEERILANKAIPKVRKKRRKSPIDIVKNLQYKKEDAALNLKSILPSSIVGAQKLVVFNTKYNTVTLFEANSQYGLSVKGTTVIDFDESKSKTKKIRKPAKFFEAIKDKGIRVFKSTFDSVKCVEKPAKGRINSETIIYGVY